MTVMYIIKTCLYHGYLQRYTEMFAKLEVCFIDLSLDGDYAPNKRKFNINSEIHAQ